MWHFLIIRGIYLFKKLLSRQIILNFKNLENKIENKIKYNKNILKNTNKVYKNCKKIIKKLEIWK
jgi:surface polysaccharide O-acyltransferase-like enzyme